MTPRASDQHRHHNHPPKPPCRAGGQLSPPHHTPPRHGRLRACGRAKPGHRRLLGKHRRDRERGALPLFPSFNYPLCDANHSLTHHPTTHTQIPPLWQIDGRLSGPYNRVTTDLLPRLRALVSDIISSRREALRAGDTAAAGSADLLGVLLMEGEKEGVEGGGSGRSFSDEDIQVRGGGVDHHRIYPPSPGHTS